jgi:gamma-glutamylcyclotransferase (GGCT)/AIG2-like uncharacterized protein YtfP
MSKPANTRKGYMFVYGTLLPRLAPPEIEPTVRRLRRVGQGTIRGRLFDFGEYPAAVLTRNGPTIKGLVFEVPNDPEVLNRLDEFEGFDPAKPKSSLFVRKRRRAEMQDGTKIFCWVYAYNGSVKEARPVATGDYSKSRPHR